MKKLNLTTAALCMAFLVGVACAGELTKFTTETPTVKVGEPVMFLVEGKAKCGVDMDNGNGKKWHIFLGDPGPIPSKVFGTTYDTPNIYTVVANPNPYPQEKGLCAPIGKPLTLKIKVVGATPEATKPGTPPKTFVPASTTPTKPTTPPCVQDEAAQARQLLAGIKVDICAPKKPNPPCVHTEAEIQRAKIAGVIVTLCTPTKPTTPPCVKDEAAQTRQLKAGNKVDICPPTSETPPTCVKSTAEQSEYFKKYAKSAPICE
jgi:hypothetical protein